MRIRPAPAAAPVAFTIGALLVLAGTSGPGVASGASPGLTGSAVPALTSTAARARSSADGLKVTVYGSPSPATTNGTVRFRIEAEAKHARGALSYELTYGDGSSSPNVTPEICRGGVESPLSQSWQLRHRYHEPGVYHVVAYVRAMCTPAHVTVRLTIEVVGARSPGTAASICGSITQLSVMVVDRDVALHRERYRFSFPARVVVDQRREVRAVARDLCALAPMPTGITSCPADWGIDYRLRFAAPGRRFDRVVADASGCERVTGVTSVTRRAAASFWNALGKAVGLSPQPGGSPYGYPFGTRGTVTTYVPPTAS